MRKGNEKEVCMDVDRRMLEDTARDDRLILVDGLDRGIGCATKLRAHVEGRLHRAFSVVLVREGSDGPQLLLSRRAQGKYHSAGLWANSCCSHPRVGEETIVAAYRRVREELGCEALDLFEVAAFVYRATFDNGLVEHEFDHVLLGACQGTLRPDPSEVDEVRWVGIDALATELAYQPERFSAWAPMVLSIALAKVGGLGSSRSS